MVDMRSMATQCTLLSAHAKEKAFNETTVPTAWMPPLYPFILALLSIILKFKLIVAVGVLFIKILF
jgi:hypothetical protein